MRTDNTGKIVILGVLAITALLACTGLIAAQTKVEPEWDRGEPSALKLEPGVAYRLENQFSGWVFLNSGRTYGSAKANDSAHWTMAEVSSGVFTILGVEQKKYVQTPKKGSLFPTLSPTLQGTKSHWEIKKELQDGRDFGIYTIQNVESGLYLTAGIDPKVPYLRHAGARIEVHLRKKDRRRQLWVIEPRSIEPVDTLAITQAGWTPDAPKNAVLVRRKKLSAEPEYTVTVKGKTLKGKSIYWGTFWRAKVYKREEGKPEDLDKERLHYYVLNLNFPELNTPGKYVVRCDGQDATIMVTNHWPRRRQGWDQFLISDLFDRDWGYVGHWAHLSNWIDGEERLGAVQWFLNRNSKEHRELESPYPVTDEDARKTYVGVWDMTDQLGHSYGRDGRTLLWLSHLYNTVESPEVRQMIYDEIIYGVEGLLLRQREDGSWRTKAIRWTYDVRIVAELGLGLTAAQSIVVTRDKKLAARMDAVGSKAWKYVHDRSDKPELMLVDYTGHTVKTKKPLKWNPNGNYLAFAMERVCCGDKSLKPMVDDLILKMKKPSNIPSLLRYYDHVNDMRLKTKIKDLVTQHFNKAIDVAGFLDGPFGSYEGQFATNHSGGQWWFPYIISSAMMIYDKFGDEYGKGMLITQKVLDYHFGSNTYASSTVSGVGDRFPVMGYESYHALGRHMSFDSPQCEYQGQLTGSGTSWPGAETTPAGAVTFWVAATLLMKHANKWPASVELFPDKNFKGLSMRLPVGIYDVHHLKAYGIRPNDLESLKVAKGLKVTLYDKPCKDKRKAKTVQLTSDSDDLSSVEFANMTKSIEVSMD